MNILGVGFILGFVSEAFNHLDKTFDQYLLKIATAKTEKDIDEAAKFLADGIGQIAGLIVAALILYLLRKGGKTAIKEFKSSTLGQNLTKRMGEAELTKWLEEKLSKEEKKQNINNAQINRRHCLNSNNIANGKTRSGTFAPKEILDADLKTYNEGKFIKTSNGDVLINGRVYGIKNEGKTLFPRSGGAPEFMDLTQGQIKAIQILKKVPIEKVDIAIKGADISEADLMFAKEFISKY